ncbi:MAG: hydrolase, partial [Anaerolineae bacterium]|nr:hydrolase [Anaerolineae bacterium]
MLLINHANVATWGQSPQILSDHAVAIEDGLIQTVGPSADLAARWPDAERLDAKGQWLMPGNICAHTHFYGAYARGLAIPGPAPEDFPQI